MNDNEYKTAKKWILKEYDNANDNSASNPTINTHTDDANNMNAQYISNLPQGSYDIIDQEWLGDVMIYFHAPIKYIVHYFVHR